MGPKSKIIAPESAQSSPQKRTGPRPTSPTEHCLRQGASPRKPKRRPKPKAPATQEEIAAQISARIAQLSAAPAVTTSQQSSVKVKSIAELRSTKIARLTTKIAVNEAEIARLEREYANAKVRLDRETEALETRREALNDVASSTNAIANSGDADAKTQATLRLMDDARLKLENVADRAQDLLYRFRKGDVTEHATMRELKNLLEGAKDGGCDVAGLCQMVGALDFAGSAGQDAQEELKKARKRKVHDVRRQEKNVQREENHAKERLAEIESVVKPANTDTISANYRDELISESVD